MSINNLYNSGGKQLFCVKQLEKFSIWKEVSLPADSLVPPPQKSQFSNARITRVVPFVHSCFDVFVNSGKFIPDHHTCVRELENSGCQQKSIQHWIFNGKLSSERMFPWSPKEKKPLLRLELQTQFVLLFKIMGHFPRFGPPPPWHLSRIAGQSAKFSRLTRGCVEAKRNEPEYRAEHIQHQNHKSDEFIWHQVNSVLCGFVRGQHQVQVGTVVVAVTHIHCIGEHCRQTHHCDASDLFSVAVCDTT